MSKLIASKIYHADIEGGRYLYTTYGDKILHVFDALGKDVATILGVGCETEREAELVLRGYDEGRMDGIIAGRVQAGRELEAVLNPKVD